MSVSCAAPTLQPPGLCCRTPPWHPRSLLMPQVQSSPAQSNPVQSSPIQSSQPLTDFSWLLEGEVHLRLGCERSGELPTYRAGPHRRRTPSRELPTHSTDPLGVVVGPADTRNC